MENCILVKCFGKSVIIYDKKGKEITRREGFSNPSFFYVKFPATLDFWNFSARGAEIISFQIAPIEYPKIKLPSYDKIPVLTEIKNKTYVPDWHSPASINCKTGQMIYNSKFKSYSIAKQLFIVAHEKGHFYYNTEKFCDLFATVSILKLGFGLSQCLEVLRNTLNEGVQKKERYDYVYKMIKNSL
jgi:hypothetical protein